MDTGRQLIRWALPGWVTVMFWTGFIGVNTLLSGQSQPIYLDILKKMIDLIIPLGVASVPLGFIIYQIYYWVYWYVPVPSLAKRKFIDPIDRGREILSAVEDHVDFGHIFYRQLNDTSPTAFKKWGHIYYKSIEVMKKYRENWHLADSAWYLALSDDRYKNTATFLEKRNQFLGDIYHSLGACYNALILAFLGYIVTFGYISFIEASAFFSSITSYSLATILTILKVIILRLVSPAINSIILFLAFRMFKGGRMASFDALLTLKHDVITNVMLNRLTETGETWIKVKSDQ